MLIYVILISFQLNFIIYLLQHHPTEMSIFDDILTHKEIPFYDIFETMSHFLHPYKKYMNSISDYNGEDPFIATLCIGVFACFRSFETPYEKKTFIIKLLNQYISNLRTYKYTAKNHDTKPWYSFMKWNKIKLANIPRETIFSRIPNFVDNIYRNHQDYYNTQQAVYNLFNYGLTSTEYHEDYNNYQTFIITSFYSTLNDVEETTGREIMERFVKHFVEFHLDDTECVYDNYTTCKSYSL